MNNALKKEIIDALREYIKANDASRKSPCGWQSCAPGDTPEWKEYAILSEKYRQASSKLWEVTNVEYDENGFYEFVWNWRYWKVMARKCCWYQRFGTTYKAGKTMKKLAKAEFEFVQACGLESIYRSSCSYIEEAFPKLKMS